MTELNEEKRIELIKQITDKLDENKVYYHCFGCGSLYADKKRSIEILSLYGLGRKHKTSIPAELLKYEITTGLCNKCMTKLK